MDNVTALPVGELAPVAVPRDRTTEIQFLRSSSFIQKAVTKLKEKYPNISPRQISADIKIQQIPNTQILRVELVGPDPVQIRDTLQTLSDAYVNYSLESRRSQAANALKFIDEQLPLAQAKLRETTDAIRVFRETYGIGDPDSYANLLIGIRQGYQDQIRNTNISLEQARKREKELQQQLRALGQDPGTILQFSILSQDQGYSSLVAQMQEVETNLALERLRYREDSPNIQVLQERQQVLRNLARQQAERVLGQIQRPKAVEPSPGSTPITPLITDSLVNQPALESPPDPEKPLITNQQLGSESIPLRENLASQLLALQLDIVMQTAAIEILKSAEAEMGRRFIEVPKLQQDFAELQRRNAIDSGLVTTFLTRQQELRIAEAQESAPWLLIDSPEIPEAPFSPDIQRNLITGLAAGAVLGLGVALLWEQLDQRVKGLEEAKDLTRLPLLGAVPKAQGELFGGGSLNPSNRYQLPGRLQLTESFRSVAINVGYLGGTGKVKVLALTSAIPAEGKTTVSYQLAIALAELGRRVLLVDADMRRPSIHGLIQEANAVGLSTIIATDRSWQEVIHPLIPNKLDIITAGPTPPNPVALLDSTRMSQLITEWRQVYNYVIIDTPPVVGITDAQSIARQVDGMVLVVGLEKADRTTVARAVEVLRSGENNLVGMIVNFLGKSNEGYYYQYYSSYYNDAEQAEVDPGLTPSGSQRQLKSQ
jgi:capsular exopolysaccharide synthesis family protein